MENGYNGYKNWETWNAMLWLDNDEYNYNFKLEYLKRCKRRNVKPSYTGLLNRHFWELVNYDMSFKNNKICRSEISSYLIEEMEGLI